MGIGVQREAGGEVSQHTGDRFDVHTVLQSQSCRRVPLWYNTDKPEESRSFKGFQGFEPDF